MGVRPGGRNNNTPHFLPGLSQQPTLPRLTGMDDVSAGNAGQDPPVHAERVWRAFLAGLDALLVDERALVLLHDVFGLPLGEVAPLLGLSQATCQARLRDARRCMHEYARQLESRPP